MRCKICDELLSETDIKDDPLTGELRECSVCWSVIQDTLEGLKKRDNTEDDTDEFDRYLLEIEDEPWDDVTTSTDQRIQKNSS